MIDVSSTYLIEDRYCRIALFIPEIYSSQTNGKINSQYRIERETMGIPKQLQSIHSGLHPMSVTFSICVSYINIISYLLSVFCK